MLPVPSSFFFFFFLKLGHTLTIVARGLRPRPCARTPNSEPCHFTEPLRMLLFYLPAHWSQTDTCWPDSPPPPAAPAAVKVGRPRMKACRSDERHRLTTNFHQSSCRQGEEGEARRHLGKWGEGRVRGLFLLWRFATTYQAPPPGSPPSGDTGPCTLAKTPQLLPGETRRFVASGKIGNCRRRCNNNMTLIWDATLSHDKYMPTFIPFSVFFALLPSVRILSMARIVFFSLASSN